MAAYDDPGQTFAAIDCGTLSTRLLIKTASGGTVVRLARITALGDGVDGTRALKAAAIERALAVLREYREIMDGHGVAPLSAVMVGTSALRDASNRADFSSQAEAVTGVPLRLLSGHEEAQFSFNGATAELPPETGPWLVTDIGGGSTELVAGPAPAAALSLDFGCVRVTERFFAEGPPTPDQLAAAATWVSGQLAEALGRAPQLTAARSLVGLAGTVAALACLDQGLATYSREAVHHYRLRRERVEGLLAQLASVPAAERSRRFGVEPARARFIVGELWCLAR